MKKILFFVLISIYSFAQTGKPQGIDNMATPTFKGINVRKQTIITTPSLGITLGNINGRIVSKDSLGALNQYLISSDISGGYMPFSGGRFTGAVTFANTTSTSNYTDVTTGFSNTGTLAKFYLDYHTKVGGSTVTWHPLTINTDGQVGINNQSPTESLSVTGNIGASGYISAGNISGTNLNTGDNATNSQYSGLATSKQDALNGTGFVKATGTTISYDNSTYLSTSSASSTYLPIANPTATGTATLPTISNTLGANFATTSGNVGIGTASATEKLHIQGSGNVLSLIQSISNSGIALNRIKGLNSIGGILNFEQGINILTGNSFETYDRQNAQLIDSYTVGGSRSLYTNGTNRLNIFNTGNIGIATSTDAGYKLDVNGTARFVNGVNLATTSGNVGIGSGSPGSKLEVFNNSNIVTQDIYANNVAGNSFGLRIYAGTNTSDFNLRLRDRADTKDFVYVRGDGNIGIGTASLAASAILDITSTTQGVLFPRLTTTQINAIASPANGLTVYNTTLAVLCFYDGTAWKRVSHSAM